MTIAIFNNASKIQPKHFGVYVQFMVTEDTNKKSFEPKAELPSKDVYNGCWGSLVRLQSNSGTSRSHPDSRRISLSLTPLPKKHICI